MNTIRNEVRSTLSTKIPVYGVGTFDAYLLSLGCLVRPPVYIYIAKYNKQRRHDSFRDNEA